MGTYADVKSKRLRNALRWLENHKDIEVSAGGKHNTKVTCIHTGESYPLPLSHAESVNKNIVKHFVEWLVKNGVCTKEEFDKLL